MTICDNDHEEIFFKSPFRALCPLCAMRVKLTEEFKHELDFEIARKEEAEDDAALMESDKDRAVEAMHKAEEALDLAEIELKELRAYKEAHP